MIKKIFLIVTCSTILILAQDENKNLPSVELPDFVITGKDAIDIKKVKKPLPDFISTVSGEFFKPTISPEELELKEFPNPIKQEKQLLDSMNSYNGYLEAGAGIHSLPVGKIIYTIPFQRGNVFGKFGVLNRIAHVDNSELLGFNAGAGISYFTGTDDEFLPGTELRFSGDYKSTDYKTYGAEVPVDKTLSDGNLKLQISNNYLNGVLFGANIGGNFSSLQKEKFSESVFFTDLYTKFDLSTFNLGFNFLYELQNVNLERVGNNTLDFVIARPFIGFNFTNNIKTSFGFTYTKSAKEAYSFPYAAFAFKVDKYVSLFGEYAPGAEFITNTKLLRQNRYYDPETYFNILFEKKHLFRFTMKYEYEKYFQIDGGFEYMATDNIPYLTDRLIKGVFAVNKSDAVSYSGFVRLLFHTGPYGVLYGSIEGNDTKNGSKKFIPYYPQIKSSLSYGYNFNFGLSSEAILSYNSKVFTDIENTNSLSSYFDLGLRFAYPLSTNFNLTFELANLFNRKNYFWNSYKEPPLDATLGINLKW